MKATQRQTVSVRLDPEQARRLKKAAGLMKQSQGAFLGRAGDEAARRTLLEWAVDRYRRGAATFSELAAETGLAVEEIMADMGDRDPGAALDTFLSMCRTVAETQDNPTFLRLAESVAARMAAGDPSAGAPAGAGERG